MGATLAMANHNEASADKAEAQRRIGEAAERALAEAEARRSKAAQPPPAPEIDGRQGPEPVRYGDWESRGLASDF